MEKIIHQAWTYKDKVMDEKEKLWVSSVKNVYTDYEYKLWSDNDNENLIKNHYPEFYDFYNTLLSVQKCDFARYLYMHHCGGMYFDIDVKMYKPLILDDSDTFLVKSPDLNPLIFNFFLASKKNNPFFYHLCKSLVNGTIYNILSSHTDKKHKHIMSYQVGSFMLSKFYLLNKDKYNIQTLNDTFGYNVEDTTGKFCGVHFFINTWKS